MEKLETKKDTEDNTNKPKNEEEKQVNKEHEEAMKNINPDFNTSKIPLSTSTDKKKKQTIDITFAPINRNNYNQLKQLNNMTLPVRYQNGFYQRIIFNLRYGRYAYYYDIIVGAISWKYDNCEGVRSIYLMTISVLDEYRRYGIGSKLLNEMIKIHQNLKEVEYIQLHVQVSNTVALKFYERNNFEKVRLIENYYTGTEIDPKDAWYLRYKLHSEDQNEKNNK